MIHRLTSSRHTLGVAALLFLALLLSACGPVHLDPRWASIDAIADGAQVILAFGDRMTLVNTSDGKPVPLLNDAGEVRLDEQGNPRIWEVRATDNQQTRFYTTPVFVDEDTLLVSSYDHRMLEVDFPVARLEGRSRRFDQAIVAAPLYDEDRIYVGLSDRNVVALNADNLNELWTVETGHGVWATPLVVGDTLYFTSMDHYLYAVDKMTGELRWKTDLRGALTSTPVYEDGHLYVGGFANKVYDVSAETGEILAEFPTNGWVWNSPALADGVLYVSDLNGSVYAIETDGGLTGRWTTKVSERATPPTPLVTDQFVIVGSRDQNVYWLNREDGTIADQKAVAGEVLANLLLIEPNENNDLTEPLVIVSTSAPQELLVAFTLERGQRVWVYGR